MDRSQPDIPSAGSVAACFLQMIEKAADEGRVKIAEIKRGRSLVEFLPGETLWLRLVPARRPPVDLIVEREASCLVQVVGCRARTRQVRPIHIQCTNNENELRHDPETLHRTRRS